MLLELLISATRPVPHTPIARMLWRIDRTLLRVAVIDARLQAQSRAASIGQKPHAARARFRETHADSRPSMTTSPEAMTSAPAT